MLGDVRGELGGERAGAGEVAGAPAAWPSASGSAVAAALRARAAVLRVPADRLPVPRPEARPVLVLVRPVAAVAAGAARRVRGLRGVPSEGVASVIPTWWHQEVSDG